MKHKIEIFIFKIKNIQLVSVKFCIYFKVKFKFSILISFLIKIENIMMVFKLKICRIALGISYI